MLVCGIDIGTTNLKVALFDGENRLVWLRSEATPRSRDEIGTVTCPPSAPTEQFGLIA